MKEIGVLDQVAIAAKRHNRLALVAGSIMGGFVPVASFQIAHHEVQDNPVMWLAVGAGLAYSALSVYAWSKVALRSQWKAVGFCCLMELTMTFSETVWLSYGALALLVAINAIACACQLILDRRETRKKK